MKNLLLVTIILGMPFFARAHCPTEIVQGQDTYCASVEWLLGDKKIKGSYVEVDVESPYRVPMREVSQKWVYSKAFVSVWAKGDHSQTPVFLNGFRVFQYMSMESGHHHGGEYDFEKLEAEGGYLLSKMSLHQMRGCWALRWTFSEEDSMGTSFEVFKIENYKNLSEMDNKMALGMCQDSGMSAGGHTSGHHGHN